MASDQYLLHAISVVASTVERRPLSPSERLEFARALQVFKPRFRELLARPPPKAEDRAQVKRLQVQLPDGKLTQLDDIDVQVAIKLSDDYNLNEIECVRLIVAAHREFMLAGRGARAAFQLSAGQFFLERKTLLEALHSLLQLVANATFADPLIFKEVFAYLEDLLEGGLRTRLLSLIRELNREDANGVGGPSAEPEVMDSRSTSVKRSDVVQEERRTIAGCLLYSCFVKRINASEAKEIFLMLKDCAREWVAAPSNVSLQVLYRLLFTLVGSFVSEMLGGGSKPNVLSQDGVFKKDFYQLIANLPPSSSEVHGLVTLVRMVFGVFLAVTSPPPTAGRSSADDQAIKACLEPDSLLSFFRFLVDHMFRSPVFQNDDDDMKGAICTILNGLLRSLFTNPSCHEVVRVLKNVSVSEAAQSNQDHFSNQAAKAVTTLSKQSDAFLALLEAVGGIYQCEPKLMTNNQELWSFVKFVGEEHRGFKTVTAFLDLLTALATGEEGARQVYSYLADETSPVISWRRLFETLQCYDERLSKAVQQPDWRLPQARTLVSGVMKGDAEVLEAYLRCLKKVVEQGSYEERQGWFTQIQPLFWLLQYSMVPPPLKGALRAAIGAFVDVSPMYRNSVWSLLGDYDQLRKQHGDSRAIQKGYDISVELTEMESRLEQYSSTLSYIELRNYFIAGESSGMEQGRSYVDLTDLPDLFRFVKDDVFAKYGQRAYKDPSEKWQLAVACLTHFELMLRMYDPVQELMAEHPGQEIMKDLMSADAIYRNIMTIVMLGSEAVMEARATHAYGIFIEEAVSLCLHILLLAFEKDLSLADKWPAQYQPLHSLLEYDSRQMVALLEYIGYEGMPEISRYSIQIMGVLSERVTMLVAAIIERGATKSLKFHYAISLERRLKAVSDPLPENEDPGFLILQLCLDALEKPTPNVAHLLLGFDVKLSVERTILQPKGDFDCFHVILSSLRDVEGPRNDRLREMSLELLHNLCIDLPTCGPTIDFLQGLHFDFLLELLDEVACEPLPSRVRQASRVSALQQRAWILKLLALGLHTAEPALLEQYRVYQTFLGQLFLQAQSQSHVRGPEGAANGFNNLLLGNGDVTDDVRKAKALEILDLLLYRVPSTQIQWPPQKAALFKELRLHELLENPSSTAEGGLHFRTQRGDNLIDVTRLESCLLQEYKRVEVSHNLAGNPSQQMVLRQAVQEALEWAERCNHLVEEQAAQLHLTVAWTQLVQIAIIERYELLNLDFSSQPLFEVMGATLNAVTSSDCSLKMALQLSEVALTIMTKLQALSIASIDDGTGDISGDVTFVDLLVTHHLPTASCSVILSRLVASILRHDSSEILRRRLYATLLIYLQYCHGSIRPMLPQAVMTSLVSNGRIEDDGAEIDKMRRDQADLSRANFDILRSEAVALIDILARDANNGAETGRSLAYNTLTYLLSVEQENNSAVFLSQLQSQALLQSCLAVIASSAYHAVLMPSPESMRQQYTQQAQLFLLQKVTNEKNKRGAKLISAMGGLRSFAACRVLSFPVQNESESSKSVFGSLIVPPQRQRYHQIVAPILSLVLSISELAGSSTDDSIRESDGVVSEVADFLDIHQPLVERVLEDKNPIPNLADLTELSLVTGILKREWPVRDSGPHKGRGEIKREIRRDALYQLAVDYLLPSSESPVKYVKYIQAIERLGDASPEQREAAREMDAKVLIIRQNLIDYLRTVVVQHGELFHAYQQVSETGEHEGGRYRAKGKRPTLTLIAQFLKETTGTFLAAVEDKTTLLAKIMDVNEIPRHEVEELIKAYGSGRTPTSVASIRNRRHIAMQEMVRTASAKENQLTTLLQIIEYCLIILYSHFKKLVIGRQKPLSNGLSTERTSLARVSSADSSSQREISFEASNRIGGRDAIGTVAKLIVPCFQQLEKASEERVGQSLDTVMRLIQLFRGHIFLDNYTSLF